MQSDYNHEIAQLEKIFQIKTKNKKLFQNALTHGSFTKENEISTLENYERLEFLGDAVLKLCVSNILYKIFPNYSEGELTKIRSIAISDNSLAEVATKIGLKPLLIMGKQEEKMGGRDKKSILACAFEAILGAYYLDGKFSELSKFLEDCLNDLINEVDNHFEKFNAKAVLQEYTQAQNKKLPKYNITKEVGPEHNKVFVIEVKYMEEVLATGEGKTKRDAEQNAAYNACLKLKIINEEDK